MNINSAFCSISVIILLQIDLKSLHMYMQHWQKLLQSWCWLWLISWSQARVKREIIWKSKETIVLISRASPFLHNILWKAIMSVFYGSYIQPECREDLAQQVRVKGRVQSCCIGLLMHPRPEEDRLVGGLLFFSFFITMTKGHTYTYVSSGGAAS